MEKTFCVLGVFIIILGVKFPLCSQIVQTSYWLQSNKELNCGYLT